MKKLSQKLNKGKLYLIPTIIGEDTQQEVLPNIIIKHIKDISIFYVENLRTARRHIKRLVKEKDIDKTIFYSFGKHDTINLEKDLLTHIIKGEDVGVLSEAGTPCIADPGAEIVKYAHEFQIEIVPLTGPCSITLALMASGMNGQNFAFLGYLPINTNERKKKIKSIEVIAKKNKQTQIFIETPYRNNQLFDTILKTCNSDTNLCLATNLTLTSQDIKTRKISEWRNRKINLHKKPTIFLIS